MSGWSSLVLFPTAMCGDNYSLALEIPEMLVYESVSFKEDSGYRLVTMYLNYLSGS